MSLDLNELDALLRYGTEEEETPAAPVADAEPAADAEDDEPNLLQRVTQPVIDLVTGADDSALNNVNAAIGVAGETFARGLYNTGYDVLAETLGMGVGEEQEAITGFNDDGTFKREVIVRPELPEEPKPRPAMFKNGTVSDEYMDYLLEQPDFKGPRLGLLPLYTGTKRRVLNEKGELETVHKDAPLPFLGDVERITTGNPVSDFAFSTIGNLAQLFFLNKGLKSAGMPASPGAAALNRKIATSSNPVVRGGLTFARETTDLLPASVLQSQINNPYIDGTATSQLGDLAVAGAQKYFPDDPKMQGFAAKLQEYTDVLKVDPDDPLATARGKALLDELMVLAPLGGGLGTLFSGLSKGGMQGAAFREASETMSQAEREAAQALIEAMRANSVQRRSREVPVPEEGAAANEVVDVEAKPQVRVVRGAERHMQQMQRAEELREAAGIERPEATEQLTTDPDRPRVLAPADADQLAETANQKVVEKLQALQTVTVRAKELVDPQTPVIEGVDPQVATLPTEVIKTAPKQLQYKLVHGKSGATGSLGDVQGYDPELAGTMLVWRDVEGELGNPGEIYAVDGHNRLDLANRTGWKGGINVQFIDAPDAATARMKGALSNIANGQGTAIDAAKAMRDGNLSIKDLRDKNLSVKAGIANSAIGLKGLPQDLFDRVVDGKLTVNQGAIVGRAALDAQVMRELLQAAGKKKWTDGKLREAVAMSYDAQTVIDGGGTTIPGLEEFTSTDWNKRMDVRMAIRGHHNNIIKAMGAVTNAKKSVELEKAGNVLDLESSQNAEEAARRGMAIFNQVVGQQGPISDLITDLVGQIGPGKSATRVVEQNAERIRQALEDYVKFDLTPKEVAKQQTQKAKAKTAAEDAAAAESSEPVVEAVAQRKRGQIKEAEQYARDIVRKSFAAYPAAKQQELYEHILRERLEHGAIVSTPFPVNGKAEQFPDAELPDADDVVADIEELVRPQLPSDLKGPTRNMRYKYATVQYESDVDAAIYIYVKNERAKRLGKKTSASWERYKKFVLEDQSIPRNVAFETFEQIKAGLDAALLNNQQNLRNAANKATKGVDVTVPDTGVWQQSGSLMIDLPPLNNIVTYGRLGESLNLQRGISLLDDPTLAEDLIDEVYKITGMTRVKAEDQIKYVLTDQQAAQYGRKPGETGVARGMYVAGPREADDLIVLSMFDSAGNPTLFTKALQTIHHEAFHRLMKRNFTKKEIAVLKDAEGDLRQIAMKVIPELSADIQAGRLDFEEVAANAFMGMGLRPSLFKDVTWAEPFKRARKLLEATRNFLLGRGFQTWNDVFHKAYAGEFAARAKASSDEMAMPSVRYSIGDVNPEDMAKGVIDRYGRYQKAVESGEMSLEDALTNEIRRGISRSGKTKYVSRTGEEHAAYYKAVADSFNATNEQLTGIPKYNQSAMQKAALDMVAEYGGDSGEALEFYRRFMNNRRVGSDDPALGLTVVRYIGDVHTNVTREFAILAKESKDPVEQAEATKGLVAAFNDMMQYRREYRVQLRNSSQQMLVAKGEIESDVTTIPMRSSAELALNLPDEQLDDLMQKGAAAVPQKKGLLGDGYYLTSDFDVDAPNPEFGTGQAIGQLQSDIRILDMVEMGKRVSDLLFDLGAGPVKTKGKSIELSDQQVEILREYARDNGYSGIRYTSDYTSAKTPSDEIVIFDAEKVDRVLNTATAVDPLADQLQQGAAEIEANRFTQETSTVMDVLPADLMDDIDNGRRTSEVAALVDVLSDVARSELDVQLQFTDQLNNMAMSGADFSKQNIASMLINARKASILFSAATWSRMTQGTIARVAFAPFAEMIGHFGTSGGNALVAGLTGNKARASRAKYAMARAILAPLKYGFYTAHLPMAIKMAASSARHNVALGKVGQTRALEGTGTFGTGALDRYISTRPEDIVGNDPVRAAMYRMLSPYRQGSRAANSIDTFFTYLTGPTEKLFANFETAYLEAVSQGQHPVKSVDYAMRVAQEKASKEFADLYINENKIKDGVMTPEAVEEYLNYINYTDNLKIERKDVAPRTYKQGLNEARMEGITDPVEIHNRALQHSEEVSPIKDLVAGSKDGKFPGLNSMTGGHILHKLHKKNLGQFIFPILRAPINIWKGHLRTQTLFNIVPTNILVDTWWKDMSSENPSTRARAIGELAAAQAIFTAIHQVVESGAIQISGPNPMGYRERENAEILRDPPYSVAVRMSDGSYSDWINMEGVDLLASFMSMYSNLQEQYDYMSEEEYETRACSAALCGVGLLRELQASGQSLFVDPLNRNVMGSVKELMDLAQRAFPENPSPQSGADAAKALQRFFIRIFGSYAPAEIRNTKTDNTEMRYGPAGAGIVPRSLPEAAQVFLTELSQGFTSQNPLNTGADEDQYIYRDPVTGYPTYKANTPDLYEAYEDDSRWTMSLITKFTGLPGFRSMPRLTQGMRVHNELATLQRHYDKPIQFTNRRNMSFKDPDDANITVPMLNFEQRGLRLTNTEVNEIKRMAAQDIRINGKTQLQAMEAVIDGPDYAAVGTYRTTHTKGQPPKNKRLTLLLNVMREYRERAVLQWMKGTERGAVFLEEYERMKLEAAEGQMIFEQRKAFEEQQRADAEEYLKREEEAAAKAPAPNREEERVALEIGNFIGAVRGV